MNRKALLEWKCSVQRMVIAVPAKFIERFICQILERLTGKAENGVKISCEKILILAKDKLGL